MSKQRDRSIYSPRFWPTWLGLGMLWLVNKLPFNTQLGVGHWIGRAIYLLAKRRRHIAATNLRLCFPELSDIERERLLREVFIQNGIGIIETAMAWWSRREIFRSRVQIEGREHLDKALAGGKGVILLGAHFSTLDLGALLFSFFYPFHTMYRPHNNPVMEHFIKKGRLKSIDSLIDRSDFRAVIRALRNNEIVWYAPDQDFGPAHSVYAPFFGVPAATATATARLAKLSKAPIILISHHRTIDGRYLLRLHPPIEDFPRPSDEASAARINAEIEKGIRYEPAQYMWMHRRFKTHPNGKNWVYLLCL